MLKKSLFFGNAYHLSVSNNQLTIKSKDDASVRTVPSEDIGLVILEHPQITFSQAFVQEMSEQNVAVVFCNRNYLPVSMLWNLDSNTIQTERFRNQINASSPRKKQLWKQTVKAKIRNQANALKLTQKNAEPLLHLSKKVRSGDPDNIEGQAASRYWTSFLGSDFQRRRDGDSPNPALNYGYIVLRAAVARALSGSGLLVSQGIHHRNRYNSFCLADDIMEPYRPYVDLIVLSMLESGLDCENLGKEEKAELIKVLTVDCQIGKKKRPLMVALSETSSSLVKCFENETNKIVFPVL
ncbi:type II CRISPR-associated endonuclease Cas1 [Halocola ammonii]